MNAAKESDAHEGKISPLKVLVVDDDALNQRMMEVLLKRDGHQVDLACNGLEAFDIVKFHQYDIVFMDLQMPIMDGMEASRRIREWEKGGKRTFIVALTASYMPEDGYRLFEAGIDNYIAKPFELEHVYRMLRYSAESRSSNGNGSKPAALVLPSNGASKPGLDSDLKPSASPSAP